MNPLRLFGALCTLLLALQCGAPAAAGTAQTTKPIRIGVSGPFTGASSPIGISMREGIRIAAAQINAAGGVLGRTLELVERDDEARNERGARVVQALIEQEKVVAGIGMVNTGVALASQRHYQLARIPVITAVATGTLITRQFQPPEFADNFVFRVSASDSIQAALIATEAVVNRGFRRVAIFHDATNYGQLGRADLEEALRRHDVRPLVIERIQPGQADLTRRLERARADGAEVVLAYGIGPELAEIARGMTAIGWPAPIVGSWTLGMSGFMDNAGIHAEGTRMPQTFIAEAADRRGRAFLDAWQKATGTARIPVPPAAAQGYDATLLLAAAIRQARSLEGDPIREALENLRTPVEGVIMTYVRPFSKENHEAITLPGQVQLGEIRDGKVVFAYDSDRLQGARR